MAFEFPARPALGRADFLVAPCNAAAVAWIDRWPDWPAPALILAGPQGSGKTHLAGVLAARAGAPAPEAPSATALDKALLGQAPMPVVLEMPDDGEGLDDATETTLFHLLNHAAAEGPPLLLTGTAAAARWPVRLPDLRSRLLALPVAEITPPDDLLLEMVLIKLFADRQVIVAPEVVRYLVRRMDRSFAAAGALVARLDALALEQGKGVTLALARRVMRSLEEPDDADSTHGNPTDRPVS